MTIDLGKQHVTPEVVYNAFQIAGDAYNLGVAEGREDGVEITLEFAEWLLGNNMDGEIFIGDKCTTSVKKAFKYWKDNVEGEEE